MSPTGVRGALVTWSAPDDPGSTADISGYDVAALDSAGNIVQQMSVSGHEAVVSGLADATGYRFEVRAKTANGTGPWKITSAVTTQVISGGIQQYIDAAQQHEDAKNKLLQKNATDVEQALTNATQAPLLRALLYSSGPQAIDWANAAAQHKMAQVSAAVTLRDSLVSYSSATGEITLHSVVDTNLVYAGEIGTPNEDTQADNTESGLEFVFQPVRGPAVLARINSADAANPDAVVSEIGAYAAGTPTEPMPSDAAALPFDAQGFPDYSGGLPGTQASAAITQAGGINRQGIAHGR